MNDIPTLSVTKVLAEPYPVKRGGVKLFGVRYGYREIFYTDELPNVEVGAQILVPEYGVYTVTHSAGDLIIIENEGLQARIEKR